MKRWKRWMAGLLLMIMLPMAALAETAMVKGGWLRLRAQPSFDADTITSYFTGTTVTVDDKIGKWYKVTTPDKRHGYMYSDFLTLGSTPILGGAYVTSRNGLPVRMRSGPGTGYGVIGKYNVGTSVTILSRGTYWYYVRIGRKTGYMMAEFIYDDASPTPTPESGYTAWVTSKNGKAVNLRRTPSKAYKPIGSYRVGTEVTVLQHGVVWDYVRVGTRKGYMMTEFLTTRQSSEVVTDVTINNRTPMVGDVLTAIVTPADATVTYQWLTEGGMLLSTAASYEVAPSMVGHKIRVLVTGSGATTGMVTSGYTDPVQPKPLVTDTPTPAPTETPAPTATPEPTPTPVPKVLAGTVAIPEAVKAGVTIEPVLNLNAPDGALVYQWYQNGVLISTGATLTPTDAMAGGVLRLIVAANGYVGEVKSNTCVVRADVTTATDLD